jgi:rifampin ADP-ribosylating transferase
MQFDPENKVVKLCAQGMGLEGEGKPREAATLFYEAWDAATDNFEKFTAAHYVARHQNTVADKLRWDETALSFALTLEGDSTKDILPSLYLNIAKCYEDTGDFENALKNYESANSFAAFLPDDGYGKMIRSGIESGVKRIT